MKYNNDYIYEFLDLKMSKITNRRFIRVYSDNTVTVSAYIQNKQITISGEYDVVKICVSALESRYGEK